MKYNQDIDLKIKGNSFNKLDNKALLQYAVGAILYMPGNRENFGKEIIDKKYNNSICLDLEDAIGDNLVSKSLSIIKANLIIVNEALKNNLITIDDLPLIFIRVRNPKHLLEVYKCLGKELLEIITGFNFPKFDSSNAIEYISNFKTIKAEVITPIYFMPILESDKIMNLDTRKKELSLLSNLLEPISNYVLNIRVGATDFCNLYGVRRKINQNIYNIGFIKSCFSDIITYFGNKFVCAGPVWEYFSTNNDSTEWLDGLKNEIEMDKINGFIGKTSIHPVQIKIINYLYSVTEEDYQDSLNILGMNSNISGVEKGYNNNKMNEVKTHINWARKISLLASIYGVRGV